MIVGITGLISSGKDTAADYLCTFHGFKRMSFAGALKDAVSVIFNWDRELLEGSTKASREWREQVDPWWAERLDIPNLTPRWVLQQWGTDVVRKNFHDDIWVASVENKLRKIQDDVVITDCRFPNEINTIKRLGGLTLRTHRGEYPQWIPVALQHNTTEDLEMKAKLKQLLEDEYKIHASEYSSVGLGYDYYLDNNGTIVQLHAQINKILSQVSSLPSSK